jgi:hypothetical protein
MKNQQSFSHGLLYSVAPENISALHLLDDERRDDFDWQADESQLGGKSFVQVIRNYLKATGVKR